MNHIWNSEIITQLVADQSVERVPGDVIRWPEDCCHPSALFLIYGVCIDGATVRASFDSGSCVGCTLHASKKQNGVRKRSGGRVL